jgi:hypothetical protein
VDAHFGCLHRQLDDFLQVFAQLVTQLSELRLAVVFEAEGERLQHTQTHNSCMAYQLKATAATVELSNRSVQNITPSAKQDFLFILQI